MQNILAGVAIAGWLAVGCSFAEDAFPAELIEVQFSEIKNELSLTGAIAASDSFSASFRNGGRIIELLVEPGDIVTQGQMIAKIDPTQAEAEKKSADAQVHGAQATLTQATQDYDRAGRMLDRGVGTRAALDNATEAYIGAQSAYEQALAQQSKAQTTLDDTVLRAASPAIVTKRLVEVGRVVAPGQGIFALAREEGREAVFYVPDNPYLNDALGKPVVLKQIEYPDRRFEAYLAEVSPLLDPQTGTLRIKARITSEIDDASTLGSSVLGIITLRKQPKIVLPWTVLHSTARGEAVWVVDPKTQRVKLQDVEIAYYTAQNVVLESGLTPGQIVVGLGSQLLYPDRLVKNAADAK